MEQTVQTLISADNHWALLTVLFTTTAVAVWLEQRYRWASKMSGAIITLVFAIALVNLHVIPYSAPVFDDIVWGYAVPLAIPLLLLQTNIRKIWTDPCWGRKGGSCRGLMRAAKNAHKQCNFDQMSSGKKGGTDDGDNP